MNDISDTFNDYFNNIYKKTTYLDKYGGSTVFTTIVLVTFFSILSYYYIEANIEPIRSNWVNERCKPGIMPFAGYINAPKGTSKLDYTGENFIQCTTGVLSKVVQFFTKPVNYLTDLLMQFYEVLIDMVNKVRMLLLFLRNKLKMIFEYMIARVLNVMIPLQQMLIKIKDLLNKIQGSAVAGLMAVYGAYLTLKSFVGAFLQIVILILIIIAAAIVILWILPFTWPAAAAGTAFFLLISIPMVIIASAMSDILRVHPSDPVPGKPSCFDPDTKIKMKDGEKNIKNIKVGEILHDGAKVDAIFKITTRNTKMYCLDNVIVSGTHKVFYAEKGWINIEDHPNAISVNYKKPYIYCLNTSNKRIKINNTIFMDWDELTPTDLMKFKLMNYIPMDSNYDNIHKYMESGFYEKTPIELINGKIKPINKIKPGDILLNNEEVIALVTIDANDLNNIQKYKFSDGYIIGGPNLFLKHKDLGNFNKLKFKGTCVNNVKKLYQLITSSGSFQIKNVLVKDYNSAIENILDIRDELNLTY